MTDISHGPSPDAADRPSFPGLDVVIVGAGFAGLYMLHRARGLGLTAKVYEAGAGVGGTWFWNRYPGARVDIESQEYSYSFSEELEHEWEWTERYAAQPELLRYANHVADRFDLRRDIRFDTRIQSATFDEALRAWTVTTDAGEAVTARYCVMATGCLSTPNEPRFEGLETFRGAIYRTSAWPDSPVDFAGRAVGVIGTGSSAIQTITEIAKQDADIVVFQRTPNYSVPAHNGPIDPTEVAAWRAERDGRRRLQRLSSSGILAADPNPASALETEETERRRVFEDRWSRGGFSVGAAFADLGVDPAANAMAPAFVAGKIRQIVRDPAVAETLTPKSYPFGTKRLCIDTGYYETFNRPNVTLVDVARSPIQEITPEGVRTADAHYPVDVLVLAIGFDAMTGALSRIDIRGRAGTALRDAWADGPRAYLGLMAAGFPNLFLVTGPGSPSVLSNMIVSIEQHVDWIADCIANLERTGRGLIEPTREAQDAWVDHVNETAAGTLFPLANSWYMGANVPGKTRVFMPYLGGVGVYRERCDAVAANGYEGFLLGCAAG